MLHDEGEPIRNWLHAEDTAEAVTTIVESGKVDEIFNLELPTSVDGIEDDVLHPHKSWESQEAYQEKAKALAKSFHSQMEKFGDFYTAIKDSGPHL